MNFSRKNVTKFPTLHHFPSECNILMTITPNFARSEPMETKHPDFQRYQVWRNRNSKKPSNNSTKVGPEIGKM